MTFTQGLELQAWFELQLMIHTAGYIGHDVGTVVHVTFIEVSEHVRGRNPALVKQVICEMIKQAGKLGQERAVAVAIDPAADAVGIQRAMARRPEAHKMTEYPWPYLVPMTALPALERRYCSEEPSA